MTELWALSAAASGVDATGRAEAELEMERWLDEGGAGIILATCHRAELYGVGAAPAVRFTHTVQRGDAVEHLLRVAAGLESVIVGEDEVLHQVREALTVARKRPLDGRLHRLFETAIALGRKARSGRTASNGNLAQRAVEWLQEKAKLSDGLVVVAGAGRMGATLAHSLAAAGAKVVVSSRDADRAAALARMYGGRGVGLEAGARLVGGAVAVAVALGGPWAELEGMSNGALPPTADMSAPQAVPDHVRRRMNGNFLGIDDMYRQGRPLPGAYMKEAERLIALKAAEYIAWLDRAS